MTRVPPIDLATVPARTPASDVAFTRSVKDAQELGGSRAAYARMERGAGWATAITPDLAAYLAERDSIYLGTASAAGQPYIQHRGGTPGFLHVLDDRTLAFADLAGNKQYITVGNLAENDRAFIFAMDYANRQRIKLWGRARIIEGDAALLDRLAPARGKTERAIVFTVEAWDANCPQHIPRKVPVAALEHAAQTIARLEAENAELRAALAAQR